VASHAAARTATREVRTPTARPYGVARAVAAAPVPLPGAGFVGPHPKTATVFTSSQLMLISPPFLAR
jgi:hypothetical protein